MYIYMSVTLRNATHVDYVTYTNCKHVDTVYYTTIVSTATSGGRADTVTFAVHRDWRSLMNGQLSADP